MEKASPISKYFCKRRNGKRTAAVASALQSKKQCYTERSSLRYREITAQSIQRMQILHRGIFMPAFDRILQLARMEEMDCEFVEVTAHEGARPTHAVWQGRVYHRGGAVVQDAFRIGHRAGTAVLPPCSTPQQLTEHQNKNTRRGTAGAFILVELTGVEPVSEKKAVRVSPGAVHLLKFPQCERVHTLDTLVAS